MPRLHHINKQSSNLPVTHLPVCSPAALPEHRGPDPGLQSKTQGHIVRRARRTDPQVEFRIFQVCSLTSFQAMGSVLKRELVSSTERRFL